MKKISIILLLIISLSTTTMSSCDATAPSGESLVVPQAQGITQQEIEEMVTYDDMLKAQMDEDERKNRPDERKVEFDEDLTDPNRRWEDLTDEEREQYDNEEWKFDSRPQHFGPWWIMIDDTQKVYIHDHDIQLVFDTRLILYLYSAELEPDTWHYSGACHSESGDYKGYGYFFLTHDIAATRYDGGSYTGGINQILAKAEDIEIKLKPYYGYDNMILGLTPEELEAENIPGCEIIAQLLKYPVDCRHLKPLNLHIIL